MRNRLRRAACLTSIVTLWVACADSDDTSTSTTRDVPWTTVATGGSPGTGGAGGLGAGGAGASGGAGEGPTVVSITPADGATAVFADTSLSVTFSAPMRPESAGVTSSTTCAGTLLLSANDFQTCVPVSMPTTADDTTFTWSPTAALAPGSYRFRATIGLENAGGVPLGAAFDSAFNVGYAKTISIDGTNDFDVADGRDSSTVGATIYVAFDDTNLYLGLSHTDIVVGGSGNKFVYFLMSTDPTLQTGNGGSSDDKARFGASDARMMFHYKERIDGGDYTEFRTGSDTDWDTDWGTSNKVVNKSNGYLEASIALSELGTGVTDLLITTFTVDYDGQGGDGHLYNMMPGATEGTGIPPRDLVSYVHVTLPSGTAGGDASLLQSF